MHLCYCVRLSSSLKPLFCFYNRNTVSEILYYVVGERPKYEQLTDDENYRPSKISRADFRPPAAARNYDDADAMVSSP